MNPFNVGDDVLVILRKHSNIEKFPAKVIDNWLDDKEEYLVELSDGSRLQVLVDRDSIFRK